ncbi:MFS transporter [Algiphilus sp.]|uniref:MFS transporter n=1 Tax=Algiphilus sp. TaxID=1872431 RepID=UPI003B519E4E
MHTSEPARSAMGLFRGWWVMAAGFGCTMIAIGSTTYCFGLFVRPMAEEFGLSRADTNLGFILLLLGMAAWSPIVGRMMDRLPARAVMTTGAVSFGAGFLLLAAATTPWMLGLAIFAPVGFATVACGALAANTLTSRWFHRRRGRAMGILAVATSAGGFAVPPLLALLMGDLGWRQALAVHGIGATVVMLGLVLWLIRDRPESVGLHPDGAAEPMAGDPQAAQAAARRWTLKELLGNRNFWLIGVGVGLLFGADQALLSSIVPYGEDAGLSTQQAALLVSCLTISAIAGKLVIGALADRVDKRWLFALVAACHLVFLAVLLIEPGYAGLIVACATVGLAVGGAYPLWMTLLADAFGPASFGSVMGTMSLLVMPLSIFSVRYIGEVFDRTGSYDLAFWTFIGFAVVSALLIAAVGKRPMAPAQPATAMA